MAATTFPVDLGSATDAAFAAGAEPVDLGLADTDFGAGLMTLAAALCHDRSTMSEAAKVEIAGLLLECAAWVQAEAAKVVADIAAGRGGPTDEAAAVEQAAAEQTAATGALLGPGWRSGREPRPRFWERAVLGAQLGLSEWEAARLVSTSVALFGGRLPNAAAALEAGAVSWKHADALAAATARLDDGPAGQVEREVLGDRRVVTAGQVRRRAADLADRLDPPDARDRPAGTAAMWEQADGSVKLAATLDPVGGRILATAVDAYATPVGDCDARSVEQRWADALVEIGRVALDQLDAARAGGIRRTGRHPHLSLITDARAGGVVTTLDGAGYLGPTLLAPGDAAWLACGASVQPVAVDPAGRVVGGVVGLGDAQKRMPGPALRREIDLRDQGCRGPGCTRPAQRCRPHHVVFASLGGPSTADNLLSVCEVHHQAVHRDGWRVEFDGTTATFVDPHGRRYESPPPLARPDPPGPPPTTDEDRPFLTPYRPDPRAG